MLGLPNAPDRRWCVGYGCTRSINLCNGSVKCSDFVEAVFDKTRCPECVRELCGLCTLRLIWCRYGVLRRRDLEVE